MGAAEEEEILTEGDQMKNAISVVKEGILLGIAEDVEGRTRGQGRGLHVAADHTLAARRATRGVHAPALGRPQRDARPPSEGAAPTRALRVGPGRELLANFLTKTYFYLYDLSLCILIGAVQLGLIKSVPTLHFDLVHLQS